MKNIITITLNPAFDLHYYVDDFKKESGNYTSNFKIYAAGKGINTSRVLNELNVNNEAIIVLGCENKDYFINLLNKDKVDYYPILVDSRIRENVIIHSLDKETYINQNTIINDLDIIERIKERVCLYDLNNTYISFSGRLPLGIDKNSVVNMLKELSYKGAKLIVDSNSFNLDDLKTIHPFLIKPNKDELKSLLNEDIENIELDKLVESMINGKISDEILVTLGIDGAIWSNGNKTLKIKTKELENPISTIGAGDSTVAGYIAGLVNNLSVEESLILAISTGTSACLTEGTLPPNKDDIRLIKNETYIENKK